MGKQDDNTNAIVGILVFAVVAAVLSSCLGIAAPGAGFSAFIIFAFWGVCGWAVYKWMQKQGKK